MFSRKIMILLLVVLGLVWLAACQADGAVEEAAQPETFVDSTDGIVDTAEDVIDSTDSVVDSAESVADSTESEVDSTAVSNTLSWNQTSWADGPGFVRAENEAGYNFTAGLQRLEDGTLALSHLDAASATLNNDLNNDGYTDIIIANSGNYEFIDAPFAQIRLSNEDHTMPDAQIYWGGPDGYDQNRTTGIPGERPSSIAAMDLNLDGILDLAMAGGGEFHPPYVNSRIYWGTQDGYQRDRFVSLPTNAATGTAVGDLNKDGYPDVVFANLGDYTFPFPPSLIYWGGPDGYLADNRTELETHGVGGLVIHDMNRDGWLDIVFSNSAGFPPVDELLDYGQDYNWPPSYIYLGGPKGFSAEQRIELPTKGATGVKVADFNKDGFPDIVFANAGSFALPPLPDTFVYWGSTAGYSVDNRTDLATDGGSAVSVADLDQDGWLDLIISVTGTYLYVGKPEYPYSYIYWGGADGFSDDNRLPLATEASQGSTVTDYNGDGILDILFSQLGDFGQPYRPVRIYEGTGDRANFYDSANFTTLPGQISYGSIVVGSPDGGDHMSHGSLAVPTYDNPDAYVAKGQLVSSAYVTEAGHVWQEIDYQVEIPEGTSLVLVLEQLETSDKGESWVENGRFELRDGQNSIPLTDTGVNGTVRYRVLFTSDGSVTPILQAISFQ
ncbi:MAG: VCBS repeat-containing protein [Anaerolineales bacterium]|nr:VCBS repeat-containing protein [Anaerolineales bacterium]